MYNIMIENIELLVFNVYNFKRDRGEILMNIMIGVQVGTVNIYRRLYVYTI